MNKIVNMPRKTREKFFFAVLLSVAAVNIIFLAVMVRILGTNSSKEEPVSERKDYKTVLATYFWVGEEAGDDNGFISNIGSIWDGAWMQSYGGYDSPTDRCGYKPCGFEPKENPFYFALPYNDLDEFGRQKENAKIIPWYRETGPEETLLKNRWIEIEYNGRLAYAQWQDVGPFEEDDADYVFGNAEPKNKNGVGAALDISPAVRDYIGMRGNVFVNWRFVDFSDVPPGPWRERVTVSGVKREFLK